MSESNAARLGATDLLFEERDEPDDGGGGGGGGAGAPNDIGGGGGGGGGGPDMFRIYIFRSLQLFRSQISLKG